VLVDRCAEHGLFLDHGELAELERGAQKGVRLGMHTSAERARRRAYNEGYVKGRHDIWKIVSALFGDGDEVHRQRARRARRAARQHGAPQVEHDNDRLVAEQHRHCPQCGARMRGEERKDLWGRTATILVDVCEEHGIWLDKSELEILLDRAEQDARRRVWSYRRRAVDEGFERGYRDGQID